MSGAEAEEKRRRSQTSLQKPQIQGSGLAMEHFALSGF